MQLSAEGQHSTDVTHRKRVCFDLDKTKYYKHPDSHFVLGSAQVKKRCQLWMSKAIGSRNYQLIKAQELEEKSHSSHPDGCEGHFYPRSDCDDCITKINYL